jgi:hypothetical protein
MQNLYGKITRIEIYSFWKNRLGVDVFVESQKNPLFYSICYDDMYYFSTEYCEWDQIIALSNNE